MTPKEAAEVFTKKLPDLDIKSVHLYDENRFMIVALEKNRKEDMNSPFYVVDKRNKNIYSITPMTNIDSFNHAMRHTLPI